MAPKTFENLLDEAIEVLAEHNSAVPEDCGVDLEKFVADLKAAGGTTVAALRMVKWEDLQTMGVPTLVARRIAGVFRQEEEEPQAPTAPKRIVSEAAARKAGAQELVAAYDHTMPTNPVGEELRRRAQGNAFLVFNDDSTVNVDVSTMLLQELMDGEPPRKSYTLDDRPRRLYAVGERPPVPVDEHPLIPNNALRRDGTDDAGIAWGSLSLEVRQMLRLAVESRELSPSADRFDLFERARDGGMMALRQRYRNASMAFDEKAAAGQLPNLKTVRPGRGTSTGSSVSNHPFGSGNRVS